MYWRIIPEKKITLVYRDFFVTIAFLVPAFVLLSFLSKYK